MFITTKMKQILAATLHQDKDIVMKTLLKHGVLEPIILDNLEGVSHDSLSPAGSESLHERLLELKQRVEAFLLMANIATPTIKSEAVDHMQSVKLEDCQKLLARIEYNTQELLEKQKSTTSELQKKRTILHAKKPKISFLEPISALEKFQQDPRASQELHICTGKINKDVHEPFLKEISDTLHACVDFLTIGNEVIVKLVYFHSEKVAIDQALKRYGWTEIPLAEVFVPADLIDLKVLEEEIDALEKSLKMIEQALVKEIYAYKDELLAYWEKLHINEAYTRLHKSFSGTTYSNVFSGWVPAHAIKKLALALRQATNNRILIQIKEAHTVRDLDGKRIEPPTAMRNPAVLKPFQGLVTTYGVPAYNSIDSTGIVSVLFIIMFGFMFADAGHGFVIFLAGIVSLIMGKKKKNDLGFLLIYAGLAAIACGVMFGSYFGLQLTKPLWFDYESIAQNRASHYQLKTSIVSINDVFRISILFGVVVVYISYALNWINRLRRREFIELFLERNGVLGGWMYAVGIQLVWNYTASNYTSFGQTSHLGWALGLPMIALFFAEPIKHFLHHKKGEKAHFKPAMIGGWLGHWLIEVFEFIVNSLSNTISFIRVAGLGIAHVILMSTFYEMAAGMGPIGRISVVILGNLIVILLEGLSAGINSVRLNYYEFFTRFFVGNGRLYEPIKVN